MAVQLPRYQQQVGVSGESTGSGGSPAAASASWEAIGSGVARAGGAIIDLGESVLNKQEGIRDASDIADTMSKRKIERIVETPCNL